MSETHVQVRESELVERLIAGLPSGDVESVALEVRSHGRARTDVVLMFCGEVIAIEAKVTDWRRALGQAVLNQYCADRSYVALYDKNLSDAVLEAALGFGVGVIAIGESHCRVVGNARRNAPIASLRRKLLTSLAGIEA